ncbi:sensor histidine kinase [Paenibacillus sp. 2TAB19]|uniref:sensor histidine kinase n=1 Tax=Paenibacillus sp. 2TAB19 TaxID=3233003 RepID=UPI003F97A5E8
MKLVHQINIAFGVALVIVLSITAVLIHYVLLDHFMVAQKQDMAQVSAEITKSLEHFTTLSAVSSIDKGTVASESVTLTPVTAAGIAAIVTDAEGNYVDVKAGEFTPSVSFQLQPSAKLEATVAGAVTVENLDSVSLQKIWDGTDSRYISSVTSVPQGKLTLLTSVSKIEEIERALLGRLLLVFAIGGVLMLVLSHLITRKLIKPLMRLKEELTKVKGRQFADVQLVKASGEIGSVARTVHEMAGELNRFSRAQKQFFQNASHELKSPLMSIAGYTEGIRDGIFEGESINKGLDIILSESARLKNIVTEMTLLAKLDSEEDIYEPEVVSLKELLIETIERVNPMLVKKELSLHPSVDEHEELLVRADRDKLLQALLNISSNAVRHANKHIYIHAAVSKGHVELSISDDGNGIPEELLPYLFHRFVKGKDGESGLGLAIARAIVERCGGHITASNRKDGGAEFSLAFPVV